MMEGIELPLNYKEGVRLLRDSAEKGCGQAMQELGSRYENGRGVPLDYQQALHWHHLEPTEELPFLKLTSAIVIRWVWAWHKQWEAMKWFRLAADQTNAFSMMHIGVLYYYGLDVGQDYVVAEKWMLPAARLRNARGMFFMGQLAEKTSPKPTR